MKRLNNVAKKRKPRNARSIFKFCPKCGSNDVFWASGLPQLWSLWQCKNCSYRGPLILEDPKLAEKIEGKWKSSH